VKQNQRIFAEYMYLSQLLCQTKWDNSVSQNQPEAVENGPVRMQADHSVFDGDSVDERLLVVEEVCVGDPERVGNPVIQSQVEGDSYVGETLVPPVLLEIHGQRVVLRKQTQGKRQ